MKINREDLKTIVKECLIELLHEGLGASSAPSAVSEQRNARARNRDLEPLPGQVSRRPVSNVDPAAVRRRSMDLIEHARPQFSQVVQEAQQQRQPQSSALNALVAAAAPNPMMAAIFADTAQTTFAAQESPGAATVGDPAAKAAAAADPSSLFGEDKIDVWNRAAFAPSQPGLLHSPMALALLKGE